jgi:cytochrome c oxidase cbb3-type subunit 3
LGLRIQGHPVPPPVAENSPLASDLQPRDRPRFRDRQGWKVWAGIGLAILIVAGGTTYLAGQSTMRARLMRADPDAVPQDSDLNRFAIAYAQPVYDQYCASCHGDHLQGNSRDGVPDLTHPAWLYGEGRVAQIEHTILHGIRAGDPKGWNLADMPAFGQPNPYKRYKVEPLEPGEIRDVIEFLLVSGGKPGDRAAAARGSKIFAAKGQCFDCHSPDLQGDAAIGAPNLIDDIWLYGAGSSEDIYDSISRGRGGISPAFAQELSPVTIRALAVLVYTASHQEAAKTAVRSPGPSTGTGG